MYKNILSILSLLLFSLITDAKTQERRIALVIGNADYPKPGTLKNSVNDSIDMAKTLSELGFDVVTGNNLDRVQDDESYYPLNIIEKIESEHKKIGNELLSAIMKKKCSAIIEITGKSLEQCDVLYKTFGSHLLGAQSYKLIMNQVSKNNNEVTWLTYEIILKDNSKGWVEVNTWKDEKGIVRASFRLH